MPRKRIRPEPIFTPEETKQAQADLDASRSLCVGTTPEPTLAEKMGVSEEQFAKIVTEFNAQDLWERQRPGWPSPEFLERLNAYITRPPRRGRPRGPDPYTSKKTMDEWRLYLRKYTCKQIAQELYPSHADDMEPQIRKRISRLKKRLGPDFLSAIRSVTEIQK